jgi:hypothetical protein
MAWWKFAQSNIEQPSLFFNNWAENSEIKDEYGELPLPQGEGLPVY